MEIIGTLKAKSDTKQVSEKFKNREFVLTIEPNSKYPQHVAFQLSQDKCSLIDSCNVGDELRVQFNLRGREWSNPQGEVKYFNTLDAWKIEKLVGSNSNVPQQSNNNTSSQNTSSQNQPAQNNISSGPVFDDNDDLPF
jgi:hypothetical protein